MASTLQLYPSQILRSIEHAKKTSPGDKFGDSAFKIELSTLRTGKNSTKYINFLVNCLETAKFEPVVMKFMNLQIRAGIQPPVSDKRKFPGAKLSFSGTSTYQRKGPDGKMIVEEYGKAKIAIQKAFERLIAKAIVAKVFFHSKTNICSSIQFERIVDQNKGTKEDIEPIIRVDIPFNRGPDGQSIPLDEPPRCDIYDASKPIKNPVGNQFPFEQAKTDDGDTMKYKNLGQVLTFGSSCSGVDSQESICLSGQGISLPSKVTMLVVKRSKGRKPDPNAVFKADDLAAIGEAVVEDVKDPEELGNEAELGNADEFADITASIEKNGFEEDPELGVTTEVEEPVVAKPNAKAAAPAPAAPAAGSSTPAKAKPVAAPGPKAAATPVVKAPAKPMPKAAKAKLVPPPEEEDGEAEVDA